MPRDEIVHNLTPPNSPSRLTLLLDN
jgi:hypothetical protein